MFYFGEAEYYADESDGYVEVKVWRTGTDLSKAGTVTVHSRKTEPASAEGMFLFLNQNHIYNSSSKCILVPPSIFVSSKISSHCLSSPAGSDYVGLSHNLDFAPGVSMQTFRVFILDDLGQPELEGTERFELVLRLPLNGILGEPGKATVFINDSVSDCKRKRFNTKFSHLCHCM